MMILQSRARNFLDRRAPADVSTVFRYLTLAVQPRNPKFDRLNRPMLGKTAGRCGDAEPSRERAAVLIDCRGRYPMTTGRASLVRVVRSIRRQGWENRPVRARHAVEITAADAAADDKW